MAFPLAPLCETPAQLPPPKLPGHMLDPVSPRAPFPPKAALFCLKICHRLVYVSLLQEFLGRFHAPYVPDIYTRSNSKLAVIPNFGLLVSKCISNQACSNCARSHYACSYWASSNWARIFTKAVRTYFPIGGWSVFNKVKKTCYNSKKTTLARRQARQEGVWARRKGNCICQHHLHEEDLLTHHANTWTYLVGGKYTREEWRADRTENRR